MKKLKTIKVKTGTAQAFMGNVKSVMRAADKGDPIPPSCTLIFEDPSEMLHFLSEAKIKLIAEIRHRIKSLN